MSDTAALMGRHALVTGGSRGIGAAVVRALARHGAGVTLVGRNETTLEKARREMQNAFPDRMFFAVVMDVTDADAVNAGFAAATKAMGPVAVLVNNVGGAESATFADTDEAMFQRMLDVNLLGTFRCCRRAVGEMRDAGFGRIINIASTAGLVGYRYVSAYASAKHGVVGLTRSLALELAGSGVTINAVCPGYVDTDMTEASARAVAAKTGRDVEQIRAHFAASNPTGRLLAPEEVADKVVWLCLPEQSEVNGATIMIDDREEDK